jgi:hypothetical protein
VAYLALLVLVGGFLGLMVYLVVSAVLSKRERVSVPVCRRHRNHWRSRTLALVLTFLVVFGGAVGLFLAALEKKGPANEALAGLACLAPFLSILAWAIFAAVVRNGTIRATEMTERRITLNRVSPTFAEAVHLGRQARQAGPALLDVIEVME